jgi:predicted component of type VI protein secretion system
MLRCIRKDTVLIAVIVIFLSVLTSGCGLGQKKDNSLTTFRVTSRPDTNDGRAVHAVISSVSPQQFLTDSYETIADRAYSNPPSEGIIRVFPVIPGEITTVKVPRERVNSVGVYFLFSKPGEQWKMLLSQPVKTGYNFDLDKDTVELK